MNAADVIKCTSECWPGPCVDWSAQCVTSVCLSVVQEQYRGLELILKKCLGLLKALARGNDFVQLRMFERLDILLKIKVVESDVAVALKEVRYITLRYVAPVGTGACCLVIDVT